MTFLLAIWATIILSYSEGASEVMCTTLRPHLVHWNVEPLYGCLSWELHTQLLSLSTSWAHSSTQGTHHSSGPGQPRDHKAQRWKLSVTLTLKGRWLTRGLLGIVKYTTVNIYCAKALKFEILKCVIFFTKKQEFPINFHFDFILLLLIFIELKSKKIII